MTPWVKATSISRAAKEAVMKRDGGRCVVCGSCRGLPNAHFIPRSAGGRGIPENLVTLCPECHRAYDETGKRRVYRARLEKYLKSKYPEWDKKDLIYRKWE